MIPTGRFGAEIDEAIVRSDELVGERAELIEQLGAAHGELHEAEQADAVALAHAVRSGGPDPGVERTEAAKAVVAALERQVNGIDDAQRSLRGEIADALLSNNAELIRKLCDDAEVDRADEIVALDQARAANSKRAEAESLISYLERLREVSNVDQPLPNYEPRENRIDMRQAATNSRVPTQRIYDQLYEPLREPVAGIGADLRYLAESNGCPVIGIAVVQSGPCMVPSPSGRKAKPGSLQELGLTRIEWRRTSNWVALLIATETLQQRGIENVVRDFSPRMGAMFLGAKQVFVGDANTERIFARARGALPPEVDRRQIAENIARVREPVDPQAVLERERAERRAHEAEQQEAVA